MAKTIWCVGSMNNCWADKLSQEAITQVLVEKSKQELKFVYVDKQTSFSAQLINKINDNADLLLVYNNGMLLNGPEANIIRGIENISNLSIPLAIYGLGYCKHSYETDNFNQDMWENLQTIIGKSSLTSVRNQGTLDVFARNNIDTKNISVTPHISMFIKPNTYLNNCLQNNCIKIGINWSTDEYEKRYGSKNNAESKFNFVANTVGDICKKHDVSIYLIEHSLRNQFNTELKNTLSDSAKNILGNACYILHDEIFNDLIPPFTYTSAFFADVYRQMDVVICSGEDAGIIAFGQNVPYVGIGNGDVMRWTAEHTGMENNIIDISKSEGEIYTQLYAVIDNTILKKNELKQEMMMRYTTFEYIKDAFVDKLLALMQ